MKKILLLLTSVAVIGCSSSSSDDTGNTGDDSFDRKAMLTNWADNIIIPAYENYTAELTGLNSKVEVFVATPDQTNLDAVRTAWLDAYKAFQYIGMFEIGKAEELKLQSYSNIYPTQVDVSETDNEGIKQNIETGTYDLTTLSSIDEQGFPALDYLLFGIGTDDAEILNLYAADGLAANYKQYLLDVTSRLKSLADTVLADWKGDYRATFINNTGNTTTSSTNKLVNDYIYNFEKNVRAGKIGIPAGIFSGGNVLPDKVEAYFKNDVSKVLMQEALKAAQDFFNGKAFNSGNTGASLKSYLDYLNTIKEGDDLSSLINNQFAAAKTKVDQLSDSFSQQIESNNALTIAAYDKLQRNVVYFKVDMLSALSINVDYVDADGD